MTADNDDVGLWTIEVIVRLDREYFNVTFDGDMATVETNIEYGAEEIAVILNKIQEYREFKYEFVNAGENDYKFKRINKTC